MFFNQDLIQVKSIILDIKSNIKVNILDIKCLKMWYSSWIIICVFECGRKHNMKVILTYTKNLLNDYNLHIQNAALIYEIKLEQNATK